LLLQPTTITTTTAADTTTTTTATAITTYLEEVGDAASRETAKLAGLGTKGKHPQNVERDLMRYIKLPLAGCFHKLVIWCSGLLCVCCYRSEFSLVLNVIIVLLVSVSLVCCVFNML
jgi:hypothetical protein